MLDRVSVSLQRARARSVISGYVLVVVGLALLSNSTLWAQAAPKSRTQQLENLRLEKNATLWPERTSPVVEFVEGMVERGMLSGRLDTSGGSGLQFPVFGGMRSGNGFSMGVGYRRLDLWRDRLGVRLVARGTRARAYKLDAQVDLNALRNDRGHVDLYAVYENSPRMDFYGFGPDSKEEDRASYRLEDTAVDLRGTYRLAGPLAIQARVGALFVNTGPGTRPDVPPIPDGPEQLPGSGLNEQSNFLRYGGELRFDYRDNPGGPKVGGNYYLNWTHYRDQTTDRHSFDQLAMAVEQYVPYFNKTRVIALRAGVTMTSSSPDQTVPFYLLPTLGGNEFLRGFGWYRFSDENMMILTAEHRWHVFPGLEAALFLDAGKVAPRAQVLNLSDLEYTGGVGLRFKINETVFMRIDQGVSREGYRLMWTFSNVF